MTCFEPWDERGDGDEVFEKYLKPTEIIDYNHRRVVDYASKVLGSQNTSSVDKAKKLYYAVRDGIRYDPYVPFHLAKHYRASNVIKRGRGFCIYKASLLCALGRLAKIPSRVGFADVKNHLATPKLIKYMGTDVFGFHGFVEFFLKEKWVKATPAFNASLCVKHNVPPLEFNGLKDSIFQTHDSEKNTFMEYVRDHGTFADIPVEEIVEGWKRIYGPERVAKWIELFEKNEG